MDHHYDVAQAGQLPMPAITFGQQHENRRSFPPSAARPQHVSCPAYTHALRSIPLSSDIPIRHSVAPPAALCRMITLGLGRQFHVYYRRTFPSHKRYALRTVIFLLPSEVTPDRTFGRTF